MKQTTPANRRSLTEFAARLTERWRAGTQTKTAPDVDPDASTEQFLRDLVALPTAGGNREANRDALAYVGALLESYGMHVSQLEYNGVGSLVATSRPTKTPTVYLAAHVDVVPAPPEQFELVEKDDRYYGRGVLDMKGALAAALGTARELRGRMADYDFGIMVMTDEELGGYDGAAMLAEDGYIPRVMVLPDGGANNWDLERLAKGIWHLTIEANGKSAHGSRPWEGHNAIDALVAGIAEIKQLFPAVQGRETDTINLGMIQGGKAINQIPATASASLDMRFVSLDNQTRTTRAVAEILERHNLTLVTELRAEPMVNDPTDPLLAAYAAATEAVIGQPINWVISNAGNDGRFFVPKGVRCAVGYPIGAGHHGPEEWIAKDSLQQMQDIFLHYLEAVARD